MTQDQASRQWRIRYVVVPIIIALLGGIFLIVSTLISKQDTVPSDNKEVTATNGVAAGGDIDARDIIINKKQ